MLRQRVLVLLSVALLATPALATSGETGTVFERTIERIVATPTPAGPFVLASDARAWRVDVAEGRVVYVEAHGTESAPFYLHAEPMGQARAMFVPPASHAAYILGGPDPWRITVDPAVGADVRIKVRFVGVSSDVRGSPAAFTLTPIANDQGCIVPTVCLP